MNKTFLASIREIIENEDLKWREVLLMKQGMQNVSKTNFILMLPTKKFWNTDLLVVAFSGDTVKNINHAAER